MAHRLPGSTTPDADSPAVPDLQSLETRLAAVSQELEDCEQRRQAAKDGETLLRGELQHRVRNMLAIIRSVFTRTVESGGTLEDVSEHFCGRLDTIARYQSPGTASVFGTANLENMIRDELRTFQFGDQPNITIDGEEVRLELDLAQQLGLAIHELATNSIKYGALSPSKGDGRLQIRWRVLNQTLHFEWLETGVRVLGAAPLRRGFGREFIEEALPYQIPAKTGFELRPGGVLCTIAVALDKAGSAPAFTNLSYEPTSS